MTHPTPEPDTDRDPWEQAPGESKHKYDQFRTYLEQARPRRYSVTAERLQMHPVTIRKTAADNLWTQRAAAYDADMDQTYVAEFAEARKRAARNHMAILQAMDKKTAEALAELQPGDVEYMSKLARWIDTSMKHARTLYGDPTSHVQVSGPSGGPLQVELAAFSELTPDQQLVRLEETRSRIGRRISALAAATGNDETP